MDFGQAASEKHPAKEGVQATSSHPLPTLRPTLSKVGFGVENRRSCSRRVEASNRRQIIPLQPACCIDVACKHATLSAEENYGSTRRSRSPSMREPIGDFDVVPEDEMESCPRQTSRGRKGPGERQGLVAKRRLLPVTEVDRNYEFIGANGGSDRLGLSRTARVHSCADRKLTKGFSTNCIREPATRSKAAEVASPRSDRRHEPRRLQARLPSHRLGIVAFGLCVQAS